ALRAEWPRDGVFYYRRESYRR
ncbi:MAG: hypothetical protein QOJ93_1327, partial [Actinomycetota bacterium]|nr:hypothetical protein [Actinomycetota bacterium]